MADEQARYPIVDKILKILIKMQSSYSGITLSYIEKEFEVSRRTAERLRDAILLGIPAVEELENDGHFGREKHWGFPRSYHLKEITV